VGALPHVEHGTILIVFVILFLAAAAILGGVVLAALGRAGEMTMFPADYPPLDLGEVSATDVALLRPPMALWGYNVQATEDSLQAIAQSVSARDVEIATLRRELADVRAREPTGPLRPAAGGDESPGSHGGAASGELPSWLTLPGGAPDE
jgi:hypothetical protein